MNTGQMLITIGAIALLSIVILRVSTNLLMTDNTLNKSKVNLMAVSIATSVIEEASNKRFDHATVNKAVGDISLLTAPSSLGPESGEVNYLFNDFDDYNAYKTIPRIDSVGVTDSLAFEFEVFCIVNYVTADYPEVPSSTRQWHKRLLVKVTSDAMIDASTGKQDTIKMSTIFSYWYF